LESNIVAINGTEMEKLKLLALMYLWIHSSFPKWCLFSPYLHKAIKTKEAFAASVQRNHCSKTLKKRKPRSYGTPERYPNLKYKKLKQFIT